MLKSNLLNKVIQQGSNQKTSNIEKGKKNK